MDLSPLVVPWMNSSSGPQSIAFPEGAMMRRPNKLIGRSPAITFEPIQASGESLTYFTFSRLCRIRVMAQWRTTTAGLVRVVVWLLVIGCLVGLLTTLILASLSAAVVVTGLLAINPTTWIMGSATVGATAVVLVLRGINRRDNPRRAERPPDAA
jgi:hypothetical protein